MMLEKVTCEGPGHEMGNGQAWTRAAIATLLAAALLAVSYALPTVRFKAIGSDEEVYSIWGGIVSLWKDGNVLLAPTVFLFSIAFPILKIAILGWAWSVRRHRGRGQRLLAALELLGKWSMLDVFIVALFVGSIRIGIATASSKSGIATFTLAIVVSMVAARLAAAARRGGAPPPQRLHSPNRWAHRVTSVAATLAFAGVLATPLIKVTKGFIFSNEVGLVATSTAMAQDGERILGAFMLLTAVAAPALRSLVSLRIAFLPGPMERPVRAARFLEEWAMIDVFALSLAIVHVKLAELATADLLPGFWWTLGAGVLVWIDGMTLRALHPSGGESVTGARPKESQ